MYSNIKVYQKYLVTSIKVGLIKRWHIKDTYEMPNSAQKPYVGTQTVLYASKKEIGNYSSWVYNLTFFYYVCTYKPTVV